MKDVYQVRVESQFRDGSDRWSAIHVGPILGTYEQAVADAYTLARDYNRYKNENLRIRFTRYQRANEITKPISELLDRIKDPECDIFWETYYFFDEVENAESEIHELRDRD